ncbi:MAG: hypothetical protein DDG60_09775 [Anaerolineae bacterium]|nr:MAG: hypothetical protein DDG60_09775 [Anaerolineae bacterium]
MKPSLTTRLAPYLPYLALVVGILSLSLSAMFVRWAKAPGPVTGFYRLLFAACILTPFVIQRNRKPLSVSKSQIIFPTLAGIATALDFTFWNTAVTYTTASNATLIGNTAPLWVALVGFFFFHERLQSDFWLGLALAMSGATLIVGSDLLIHPHLGFGDLLALLASFFYAIYYLATERGRRSFDALTYAWLMALSASGALWVINLLLGNPLLGYAPSSWLIFLLSAIVAQILGYLSVTFALGHLPASVVSPTMIGQPVMTTVLAIPFLSEIPTTWQLLGGIIALVGIYLVNQAHTRAHKSIASST